jgi:dihydroneopterin aldolase
VDDQIHIEQLEVFAHIGVPDEERSTPQRLTFRGFPALCGMF